MDHSYELTCDLALLAQEIGRMLEEKHSSAARVDQISFVSEDSCCRIDTYQVYELIRSGNITINVCFFRPRLAEDRIQVKFSVLSPLWNESLKMNKLENEIDSVIRGHMDEV